MSTCNICCEKFNKSNHCSVQCPYCDFDVCRLCCETYILAEPTAKCMKPDCAKEWSRKFMREHFTDSFLSGKYKQHLEDILFDQEKSLLPATQIIIERNNEKKVIKNKIKDLNHLIDDLLREKRELERQLYRDEGFEPDTYKKFVRQCPANGCRGFLSTQWKCGICENWTCHVCHELKGPVKDCGHVCNPHNVETAKVIAKDSRPCPKCQSMIFKIDGCDQMWCTQCHTAFSWKTGALQKKIHNPHFYEWQRKNGKEVRAEGDVQCGRDLDHNTSYKIERLCSKHSELRTVVEHGKRPILSYSNNGTRMKIVYSDEIIRICKISQNFIHNRAVELNPFQIDYFTKNQDLRISYMENKISESEFKTLVQRNDKKHKKNQEIAQVFQLAFTTITDIIHRLMNDLEHNKNVKLNDVGNYILEINEIFNYCNNIFADISFTYKSSVQYKFDELFSFVKVDKKKQEKA